jgi:hypothetical protein
MRRSEEEIMALAEDLWGLMKRGGSVFGSVEAKKALLKELKALEAEAGEDFETVKLAALKLQFDRYNDLKTW